MNSTSIQQFRIVLLGAGHTNAHVIRQWAMGNRIENAELVCVSDSATATYSGMLPAVVAGDVPRAAMEIDLLRLAQRSGCRLIVAKPAKIDRIERKLIFDDRPSLDYDVLSIGIGSQPSWNDVMVAGHLGLVAIKPMQTFLDRLTSAVEHAAQRNRDMLRVAVIGGGVASLEIACCLSGRFSQRQKGTDQLDFALAQFREMQVRLISATEVGGELVAGTRRRLSKALKQYGIQTIDRQKVTRIEDGRLMFTDRSTAEFDVVIWATGAIASPFLATLGLETDGRGFLLTNADLSCVNDSRIFAVGDSGTIRDAPTPKAGVYAVRQGPILFENLRRFVNEQAPIRYLPQRGFLKLINVGLHTAIGEYRGLSFAGSRVWKLKHRIDTKFMEMYQDYRPAMTNTNASPEPPAPSDASIKCLGCGGKLSSEILRETLRLTNVSRANSDSVVIGLDQPDDAAILRFGDQEVAITTDYFATPFDDPYLFGRIVAIHTLSDLYAMGATPSAALVNMEIPFGHPKGQQRLATELMAGINDELQVASANIVGGHSIEGPRLAAGLTAIGRQSCSATKKGNLRVGDQLVLTKPLGVGLGLAAMMRNELKGVEFSRLKEVMLQDNSIALDLITNFQVQAMTDITGFGLLGHLMEMVSASFVSAELDAEKIPTIEFTQRLNELGIASSLYPANLSAATSFGVDFNEEDWRVATLFDPQTCGGLLLGVPSRKLGSVLDFLKQHGYPEAACLGRVGEPSGNLPAIRVI